VSTAGVLAADVELAWEPDSEVSCTQTVLGSMIAEQLAERLCMRCSGSEKLALSSEQTATSAYAGSKSC
jgi:hypothetical protein